MVTKGETMSRVYDIDVENFTEEDKIKAKDILKNLENKDEVYFYNEYDEQILVQKNDNLFIVDKNFNSDSIAKVMMVDYVNLIFHLDRFFNWV